MELQPGDRVRFLGPHCARTREAGLVIGETYVFKGMRGLFGDRYTLEGVQIDGADLLLLEEDLELVEA